VDDNPIKNLLYDIHSVVHFPSPLPTWSSKENELLLEDKLKPWLEELFI
jgi:hypothetical protein